MDSQTKHRKNFLTEKETRDFYKKNKSYCSMPFKEIYGDNAGRYKLCCHAKTIDWNGEFTFDTSKPDGAEEKRVLGKFTEKNLNWSPQISLENGIHSTVEWYENNILKL